MVRAVLVALLAVIPLGVISWMLWHRGPLPTAPPTVETSEATPTAVTTLPAAGGSGDASGTDTSVTPDIEVPSATLTAPKTEPELEKTVADAEMGGSGTFMAMGAGGQARYGGARARTVEVGRRSGVAVLAQPDSPADGDAYADVRDNPFVSLAQPGGDASTFAVDVDTASYANLRRFLRQDRKLPPKDAVRIEECLNAFTYAYPEPAADPAKPFAFATAVATCPWAPDHHLVRVAIRGRSLDQSTRPPLNLVFLIDTSGSMHEADRLPLVRYGLEILARQLEARDRVAIVTYAGEAGVVLPATAGTDPAILAAVRGLASGGSTNGAGGIRAAYAEALRNAGAGVQSRVILCTDGDFNVGVTDARELNELIERERATGVFLSVYGVGRGNLKDARMEALADQGNGVYAYIDSDAQALHCFGDQLLGNLVTIAKDVKIQVFFNPTEVAGWRLIGYENRQLKREDFNDDRIDAGDIGAGHTVTALYEVVPAGVAVPGERGSDPNPFTSEYAGEELGIAAGTLMRLRLRSKLPDGETSTLLEQDVPATVRPMDADFSFAAAVAGYGMLLRASPDKGATTWNLVLDLAVAGANGDPLRGEFLTLADLARRL